MPDLPATVALDGPLATSEMMRGVAVITAHAGFDSLPSMDIVSVPFDVFAGSSDVAQRLLADVAEMFVRNIGKVGPRCFMLFLSTDIWYAVDA